MSIQKIAQLAGVSVATVSRVLNNSDTVKAKNRERVLQAIQESNYQPNLLARQLRTARSYMILVMVSNIANPFCAEVVKGIEAEAEKNGYRILLCNSGSDIERSRSGLSLLSGKIVDGIITMDAFSKLPELAALIGNAPWVQCAEYADAGTVSCVGINDVDASQHAISQLADGGRKRIAMINHDLSYKYARLRERGYKSVIHLRDLDYQAVEYASELSSGAGMAAMQNLLKANPPDAVFAVSDTLAAGALRAIQQAGLRVPEDIAVVEVSEAAPRFHSRLNATGKRYRYRIINSQVPDVFWRRYATEEPEALDLDAMRKAAELLLGEHDFKAFTSAKKSKKSTVRRIDEIRIERIENRVEFVFTGNGFLHHMIRILMGTLLEVGKGIRTPESVTDVLESGDRAKAGALVPAKGLVLEEVFYT